jgi:3-oxoacyl-[acyl-carrier protein] reductase
MDIDLTGKRALVCGASEGLGLAAAKQLASQGCQVILLARREDVLSHECIKLNKAHPRNHDFISCDFAERAMLKNKLCENLTADGNFDILVNNAGAPRPGPITEVDEMDFAKAFNNHLQAAALLTQLILPGMRKQGYGRIINITSGVVKQINIGMGISNTVSASVTAWAKTLSMEVAADGVTVNCVLPSKIDTASTKKMIEGFAKARKKRVSDVKKMLLEQIPMHRFGRPEELANLIGFLASPASSYINGANIPVDGGFFEAM